MNSADEMKLFVRIPTNQMIHGALVPWLTWASRSYPSADISIQYSHGYGVAWARNRIVGDFLASDATHLRMVDSDVIPNFSTDLTEAAANYRVVAAPYQAWRGEAGVQWHVYNRVNHREFSPLRPHAWPGDFPFHVDAAGLGDVIIERSLLESLGPEPFKHGSFNSAYPTGEDFEFYADVEGVEIVPKAMARHLSTCDLAEIEEWVKRLLRRMEETCVS